ncbi:rod shape-determining protein MreD [Clostridium oryzae]|uniref:Rod shape-determining protein MreD n=1 Tax=Clostridium oryzae TaxID=1450648 RepID=A0A1V4IV23_9CLOT|nr:rod shape-determining protein MreD [Clostridium oryzae]OPJ63753.1 rod shape-determining protein MreD [Clostridium oryzae]
MKRVIIFVICVLLWFADNTLMPFFAIKGSYPNLLLIFLIFFSLNESMIEGIVLAIFVGLLQDFYFSSIIGINPLLNIFVSLAAYAIGQNIFKERRIIPVFLTLGLSVVKGVLVFCILFVIGISSKFDAIFYKAIYNAVIGIFTYKFVYKLMQSKTMMKRWKFKED